MFKNAAHSVQNIGFFTFVSHNIITTISNKIGIIYIPVTIFHIRETVAVIPVAIICATLSDPRYFGFNPTIPRAIEDKNGRN